MPEPWEWEETDLLRLASQKAGEALELEFKECGALDISTAKARDKSKSDLSKDVSAFANSAGGTIVYGIVEKNHVAERLDTGYDPGVITKEWIEQVINSNIQPRIPGVRINPVKLLVESPGNVAYVVYIPQSTTAHQASDKRYYKRFNFQSVPMEDYEVRDVMHRAAAPSLRIEAVIGGETKGVFDLQRQDVDLRSPAIEIFVVNDAAADAAEYSQYQVFLPTAFTILSGAEFVPSDTMVSWHGQRSLEYGFCELRWGPNDLPIFAGERRLLHALQFKVDARWRLVSDRAVPYLLWRTRASRSQPTFGAVVFAPILSDTWRFAPASIEQLTENGFVVHFAP